MRAALLFCLAGLAAGQTSPRYEELKRVIDRNTGFAHMTRGMNMFTLYALRSCVTEKDLPVLGQLLTDRDRVTRMSAANVLIDFGTPGKEAIEKRLRALTPKDIDDRLMLTDVLNEGASKDYKPILQYPLTDRERDGIRGCK